jgi:hypothetical protein
VFWGSCIEARPLRSIVMSARATRGDAGFLLSTVGVSANFVVVDDSNVPEDATAAAAASENRFFTSNLSKTSIAFSSCTLLARLITPSVQCSAPTGRIAFGWMRLAVLLAVCSDCCWSGETWLRKISMVLSSWGLEDTVTRGRQRKWVRGGFFREGGFFGPRRWGMVLVVVGWLVGWLVGDIVCE